MILWRTAHNGSEIRATVTHPTHTQDCLDPSCLDLVLVPCGFLRHIERMHKSYDRSQQFLLIPLPVALRPNASPGFLILEVTHNDAPQPIGLLYPNDQLVAESPTWINTTLPTQTFIPQAGFEHNLIRRVAADLRLTPSGHWDQHFSLHFPEFNIHLYSPPPHALITHITS